MAYFRCSVGSGGSGIPLVVTCASAFAGTIITCTDGTTTLTDACPSSSPYEITFNLPNTGTWTISGTISGQTFTTTVTVTETTANLNNTPDGATVTPTDDVQTLLNCANIWDKNYTTISQLLADTTSLLAVIDDNNAADYLVRSTTWATDVCADSTAMTYIGADDYCAETLLANSTWRTTICNSAYFESVLNVKVPTMTSNTTPSGECVYSTEFSELSYYAYKAFDGNSSSRWAAQGSGAIRNQYVGYKFTQPIVVNKVSLTAAYVNNYTRVKNYHIDGRVDSNSEWVSLYTGIVQNTSSTHTDTILISNETAYQDYRIYVVDNYASSNDYGISINELQFYGRATS